MISLKGWLSPVPRSSRHLRDASQKIMSSARLVLASILACGLTHVSGLLLTQRPVPRASHHRAPATLRVCTGLRQEACRSRTIVAQASEAGMTLLEDKDQYDALIADATKENRAAAGYISRAMASTATAVSREAPPQWAGPPVAERPVWPRRHRGDQVLRELVPRVQGHVAQDRHHLERVARGRALQTELNRTGLDAPTCRLGVRVRG